MSLDYLTLCEGLGLSLGLEMQGLGLARFIFVLCIKCENGLPYIAASSCALAVMLAMATKVTQISLMVSLTQWRRRTFGRLVRWSYLPPYCLRFWTRAQQ